MAEDPNHVRHQAMQPPPFVLRAPTQEGGVPQVIALSPSVRASLAFPTGPVTGKLEQKRWDVKAPAIADYVLNNSGSYAYDPKLAMLIYKAASPIPVGNKATVAALMRQPVRSEVAPRHRRSEVAPPHRFPRAVKFFHKHFPSEYWKQVATNVAASALVTMMVPASVIYGRISGRSSVPTPPPGTTLSRNADYQMEVRNIIGQLSPGALKGFSPEERFTVMQNVYTELVGLSAIFGPSTDEPGTTG